MNNAQWQEIKSSKLHVCMGLNLVVAVHITVTSVMFGNGRFAQTANTSNTLNPCLPGPASCDLCSFLSLLLHRVYSWGPCTRPSV